MGLIKASDFQANLGENEEVHLRKKTNAVGLYPDLFKSVQPEKQNQIDPHSDMLIQENKPQAVRPKVAKEFGLRVVLKARRLQGSRQNQTTTTKESDQLIKSVDPVDSDGGAETSKPSVVHTEDELIEMAIALSHDDENDFKNTNAEVNNDNTTSRADDEFSDDEAEKLGATAAIRPPIPPRRYKDKNDDDIPSIENGDLPKPRSENAREGLAAYEVVELSQVPICNSEFECGCCFSESPITESVPCEQGHLFCQDCIKRYVESVSFESAKPTLNCLSTDPACNAVFDVMDLLFLDPKMLQNLQERQQKMELATALNVELEEEGEKFHKCPFCDFKCLIDERDQSQIFFCFGCEKTSCLFCKIEWEKHMEYGQVCDHVEDHDESNIRLKTEEAMTSALVHTCHKCSMPMLKEDGCNKMTCPCGALFCHYCKQPIQGLENPYEHFCQHPTDADMRCEECNKCHLFLEPEDEAKVEAERLKGEAEREKLGVKDRKKIGGENQFVAEGELI